MPQCICDVTTRVEVDPQTFIRMPQVEARHATSNYVSPVAQTYVNDVRDDSGIFSPVHLGRVYIREDKDEEEDVKDKEDRHERVEDKDVECHYEEGNGEENNSEETEKDENDEDGEGRNKEHDNHGNFRGFHNHQEYDEEETTDGYGDKENIDANLEKMVTPLKVQNTMQAYSASTGVTHVHPGTPTNAQLRTPIGLYKHGRVNEYDDKKRFGRFVDSNIENIETPTSTLSGTKIDKIRWPTPRGSETFSLSQAEDSDSLSDESPTKSLENVEGFYNASSRKLEHTVMLIPRNR